MDRNTPPRDEPDPILSFVTTAGVEPRPRLLVDRLLYARVLLCASPVLAPRFQLGDYAAAHHILLGRAASGQAVADRLLAYGFRVEPWGSPPGIRFSLASSHSEAEIRALLVAITIAVRELVPSSAAAVSRPDREGAGRRVGP